MRRAAALAMALSICALAAPAGLAAADAVTSPFAANRVASTPTGLLPNAVATPLAFPDAPVVLTWGAVPGAVEYTVEIGDTPGFSSILWTGTTTRPVAAPEILLPDGHYWWRVRAVDAAGTVGATSDVARFAKSWPSAVGGLGLAAAPGGPAATHVSLNPYMTWADVPGATTYDLEISPGDQFASTAFYAKDYHQTFMSPSILGALPDDGYGWRVRARDAKGNPGPWTVGTPFTKTWVAPAVTAPADGAATHDLSFAWSPVDGAEGYEFQLTTRQHTWTGNPLKISASTSGTTLTPSFAESRAQSLGYGNAWWRVRPTIGGVKGAWSPVRRVVWQAPAATTAQAQLTTGGDSDTGLMPRLSWTPVTGATIYRIDIATDPGFTNPVESLVTESTSWTPRQPLPDNQVGSGYWWRVVWGTGTEADPTWLVDDADVDSATFRKQTRVTLGSPANGGVVTEPPLLTWSSVAGVARYEVQLSQNGSFGPGTRSATIWGTGAVPGATKDGDTRLPDGTWSWRVRAVDGSDAGQTWSPVGQFTLSSPRPAQTAPADGATVVMAPLLRWGAVPGACGYDVQVARDASFSGVVETEGLSTAQTALVPPAAAVTEPGVHRWRVRADYCGDVNGQWSPTRTFRSVTAPDLNLNSLPGTVPFRSRVVLSGRLTHNSRGVGADRVHLERRLPAGSAFRPAGTITTGQGGRFRVALTLTRSADYRLVWRATAKHPEGVASFGIRVAPRVTFNVASSRVARRGGLRVTGSVVPRRPAVVQMRTAAGWTTVKAVGAAKRFSLLVPTGRLDPGTHRLRLYVPRDASRRFAPAASRQRGVLVYDRFVIR